MCPLSFSINLLTNNKHLCVVELLKCKLRVETEAPGAGWLHGDWCSTAEDIKMLVCTRWRYVLLVVASAYCMHRYVVLFVFEWAPLCFWGNESLKSSDTNAEHEKRGTKTLDGWRKKMTSGEEPFTNVKQSGQPFCFPSSFSSLA